MAPLDHTNAASGVERMWGGGGGEGGRGRQRDEGEEFLTHYSLRKQWFLFFSKLTGNASEFRGGLSTTSNSIAPGSDNTTNNNKLKGKQKKGETIIDFPSEFLFFKIPQPSKWKCKQFKSSWQFKCPSLNSVFSEILWDSLGFSQNWKTLYSFNQLKPT